LPNQLFGRSDPDPHSKDIGFSSLLEPSVVDRAQPIPGAKNDINTRPSHPHLCQPPGSRGRKAWNPYEGTEPDDEPGPSLSDLMEDHTPAADEQLEEEEER
jgi:hypothetical protein